MQPDSTGFGNTLRLICIGGVLAGLSSHARADESTSDTPLTLSDLAYLPRARQLVGSTSYARTDLDNANEVSQSLSYGVKDHLTVWGALTYRWPETSYNYYAPVTDRTEPDSHLHAAFGMVFRLLDQKDHPLNLDLSAATPGRFSISLSHATGIFTLLAQGGMYRANSGALVDNIKVVDPFWGYFVGAAIQTRLTRSLSFNVGAGYTSAINSNYTYRFPDRVSTSLSLNYHVIRDKVVVGLGYQQTRPVSDPGLYPRVNSFGLHIAYSF